ncbi:MAG: PHP domain-containing protein, partial [Ilumatobacteraceae bacterium]
MTNIERPTELPLDVDLGEDNHIHSTFSDGKGTLQSNLDAGIAAGLHTLGFVDHARVDTDWLPDYLHAARAVAKRAPLTVTCGVEVKIIDTTGAIDAPDDARLVDRLVIADHQMPLEDGVHHPAAIRTDIEEGRRDGALVIEQLLESTMQAARRNPGSTLAHLFSILPKCGLDESQVTAEQLDALARVLVAADVSVELSERWECPGPVALAAFHRAGTQL